MLGIDEQRKAVCARVGEELLYDAALEEEPPARYEPRRVRGARVDDRHAHAELVKDREGAGNEIDALALLLVLLVLVVRVLQDAKDASILAHERISESGERILIVSNFTPVPHERFRLGVPYEGAYELVLNTDDTKYNGSGFDVHSVVQTEKVESEGLDQSLNLRIPPLSTVFYKLK